MYLCIQKLSSNQIVMKRKAIDYLYQWKASNDRKPLVMLGARQVGKTWLMQEFAKRPITIVRM